MKRFSIYLLPVLIFAICLTGCKKDDDDGPSGGSHKVVFKAQASAGSNIQIAVYGYDANYTTATSLSGTTWESPEMTVPAGADLAKVVVNAIGANSTSTLNAQVYVDGVLKKEGTSTGMGLSASAQHNF